MFLITGYFTFGFSTLFIKYKTTNDNVAIIIDIINITANMSSKNFLLI